MIGSDSEMGRRGRPGAFVGAPQREAKGDPHTGSDWPWAEAVRCFPMRGKNRSSLLPACSMSRF